MANRTIYTSSKVIIGETDGSDALDKDYLVTAVTSATYTTDTPREQVLSFGKKGQVATVQTESTTSTIEIVFHPYDDTNVAHDGTTGAGKGLDDDYFTPTVLNTLMTDAGADNPDGVTIDVHGVGKLTKAILTSITAEASVGALPSVTLGFDGTGASGSATIAAAAASYDISTMSDVNLYKADDSGDTSHAQTATFNWEMPVERLNKLGAAVEAAVSYGTPPGTASMSVEGTTSPSTVTQVKIGMWKFALDADAAISNKTNNLAVGEIGQTYNITVEGVADGCVASEV